MTPNERQAEFKRLFDALPGPRKVDRIRQACAVLHLKENTIRIWRMRAPSRTPTERSLQFLRAHLGA